MHSGFNAKNVQLAAAAAVATNATAGTYMDMAGYGSAVVRVMLGTSSATNAPATLKLQHADDTNATSFADITGYVGGTNSAGGFTISANDTSASNNTQIAYQFNLRQDGRLKRYVRIQFTPAGATQIFGAVAEQFRASEAPITATNAAVGVLVNPS